MKLIEKILALSFNSEVYNDILKGNISTDYVKRASLNRESKRVLYYIYKHQTCIMGELSSFFSMPHSTTNLIIKNLIVEELVAVNVSEKDQRVRQIILTEKGIKHVELMLAFLEEKMKGIFALLSNEMLIESSSHFSDDEMEVIKKFIRLYAEDTHVEA